MEYIPGDNLEAMIRDLRKKGEWLYLQEAIGLVKQTALALDYAHRQGVLHRDIKPANIMIEPEQSDELPYRPVLTDLGLAKLATGGIVTQEGTSMGTPAYMSPEQCMGEDMDSRSDVYSLGILLFELSTGRLPFPARTISDALKYHVQTPPPAPRSFRPDLPQNLEAIILKSLEKDPSHRFTSAAEMADELQRILPQTTRIASAPTTMKASVSLVTQYQQSLVNDRGASVFEDFELPNEATLDRIQILGRDRKSRAIRAKKVITIGRDEENDIPIDDPKSSRRHARIEFDGQNYRVIDLDSTNGTYLDNKRLLPGVPVTWPANTPLLIGDTWFRLLLRDTNLRSQSFSASTAPASYQNMSYIQSSPGIGQVGLHLETTQINVDPGLSATIPFTIIHQGAGSDIFKISITGIPSPWVSIPSSSFQMNSGDQRQASINIHPPRTAESRAGQYPITLSVISQTTGEFVEAKISATITSFSEILSEVKPRKIRVGETGQVVVKNSGNIPASLTLKWVDKDNSIAFTPQRVQINVAEGQEVITEFRAEPRNKSWIGGEKNQYFSVQVNPVTGASKAHKGALVSRAVIPTWVIPVLLILCIGLAAVIGLASGGLIRQANRSTQTAQANQTNQSVALLGTTGAETATALALEGANQSTQLAATQTTVWLEEDDDKDGLSNGKEQEIGTLPEKRDTDEDGLDDGEEVNNRQTDPLQPDTDGDGLKDGEEVSQGLDPLNPDSDGDGIPDAQDNAPLQTSTPTVDLNATQQAAASQTALAQTALAQTVAAADQTAAAKTAAAQTAIVQTAIAQTAIAQAATLTAAAAKPIAYIYSTDITTGQNFKSELLPQGYQVNLIMHGNVLSTNFNAYKLIMIGHETGNGANWGDPAGDQANHIASFGKPILGLGEGGYAYFGRLSLLIGYGNGAHGSEKDIIVVDSSSPIWNTPNNINIPGDSKIALYNSNSGYVAIYYPTMLMGTQPIGRHVGSPDHYPLITQIGPFFLWGFDDGPTAMSNKGRKVFENVLDYLIP